MNTNRYAFGLRITVAAIILAAWIAYNKIAYHDWRCAFVRCVRVENVR